MKPTRRQLVRMLATAVPLAGASDGTIEAVAVAAKQTAPRAAYMSERLRDLRLDDGIEPALRFRPRLQTK